MSADESNRNIKRRKTLDGTVANATGNGGGIVNGSRQAKSRSVGAQRSLSSKTRRRKANKTTSSKLRSILPTSPLTGAEGRFASPSALDYGPTKLPPEPYVGNSPFLEQKEYNLLRSDTKFVSIPAHFFIGRMLSILFQAPSSRETRRIGRASCEWVYVCQSTRSVGTLCHS